MHTKSQKPSSSVLTKGKPLKEKFFERNAVFVARELLGKVLVRRWRGREMRAIITETEAYTGPEDLASHASKELTPRTRIMFGAPARWYVYFTYGMHWMLNVVTEKEGHPAAVLIRGLSTVTGPGRVTKSFNVSRTLNGKQAEPKSGLWMEDVGIKIPRRAVVRTPRIGVDYAGPVWASKPYRFLVAGAIDKYFQNVNLKK